ncbi:MAG: hypothetical protein RDV41_13070 [Planctomycetota bacterium]|nr:hypothetical protein [Planctomycetota bacterium]
MSNNVNPNEATCPSCGRFVGPADRCAYCGAGVTQRFSLRLIKYLSLLVAVGGVLFLYLAARGLKPARVKIGELKPEMNRGYVEIEGVVDDEPRTLSSGSLSLVLDDGSGRMTVYVEEEALKELREKGVVPDEGDTVSVCGYLYYKKDRSQPWSLNLNSADRLTIKGGGESGGNGSGGGGGRSPVMQVHVKDVSTDMLGRQVTVEVSLSKVVRKTKGVIILEVEEDGSSIDVKVMEREFGKLVEQLEKSGPGTKLSVTGRVDEYKGRLQLAPAGTDDVRVLTR